MKKTILLFAFLLIGIFSFSQDHNFSGYLGGYYYQADVLDRTDTSIQRLSYGGGVYDFEHYVEGMRFAGSHLSISYDPQYKFVFTFGLAARFYFYNDWLRLEVLPPMLYIRSNVAYLRPMGVGIRIGKNRIQINIRELLREGYITSQVTLRYKIF